MDQRLKELNERRQAIQLRLEELDCVAAGQAEMNNIVTNTEKFIASLPYTLREGVPQEKLVTLRQCIERIHIDKPNGQITVNIQVVPVGNIDDTQQVDVALA